VSISLPLSPTPFKMSRITSDPFEALDEAGQLLAAGGAPATPPRRPSAGVPAAPGAPARLRRHPCDLHYGLYDDEGRHALGYTQNSSGAYSTFAPLCACDGGEGGAAAAGGAAPIPGRGLGRMRYPPEAAEEPSDAELAAAYAAGPLQPAHNQSDWFYNGIRHWTAEVERLTAQESPDADELGDALRHMADHGATDNDVYRAGAARLAPRLSHSFRGYLPDDEEGTPGPPLMPVRAPASPVAGGGPPYEVMRQGADGRSLPARAPSPAGTPPGTPPGSPLPSGPGWRTGSCGESGPFIGLGYGWSVELVKRWNAANCDQDGVWALKAQMLADLATEPNLLSDFTEQEVVDGMASSYSWPPEQTREHLATLRERRRAKWRQRQSELFWAGAEGER
jgi:hypothetical protein